MLESLPLICRDYITTIICSWELGLSSSRTSVKRSLPPHHRCGTNCGSPAVFCPQSVSCGRTLGDGWCEVRASDPLGGPFPPRGTVRLPYCIIDHCAHWTLSTAGLFQVSHRRQTTWNKKDVERVGFLTWVEPCAFHLKRQTVFKDITAGRSCFIYASPPLGVCL